MNRRATARSLFLTGAGLAVVAALAACSGSSGGAGSGSNGGAGGGPTVAPSPSASSRAAAGGNGANGGNGRGFGGAPGTSGKIAAVTGSTMQVQGTDGQTAVTWSASTTFTHRVTTTVAAVKAGDCVTAVGASGTSPTAASFTAATITLTPATNGSCTGGFGGGGRAGTRPSGFPTNRPSNLPSRVRPSGSRSAGGGFGGNVAIATGSVTSVSGSTITVAARDFQRGPSASATPSATTMTKKITVGAATTLMTTAATTATAVKIGLCALAQGKPDSSGAVAATSVLLSSPVGGQCSAGFGGRPGNGR